MPTSYHPSNRENTSTLQQLGLYLLKRLDSSQWDNAHSPDILISFLFLNQALVKKHFRLLSDIPGKQVSLEHCFTSQRGTQDKILAFTIFYLSEQFRGNITPVNNKASTNYTESAFSPADLYCTDFNPWTILSKPSHWFVLYSYTDVITVCEYLSRRPSIAEWDSL